MTKRPASLIYLFAILIAAPYTQSQSLGELARAEKEKKDAKGAAAGTHKVYTNDDFKPASSATSAAKTGEVIKGNPYAGKSKPQVQKMAADLELQMTYALKLVRDVTDPRGKAAWQKTADADRAELEKIHQAFPDIAVDLQGGSIDEKTRKVVSLMSDQERKQAIPQAEQLVAYLAKLRDVCLAAQEHPCDDLVSDLRDATAQLEMLRKMTR